jgi:oligopeptide/dipeptide ABC transporter ATP-binding protein
MYLGRIVEHGPVKEVIARPKHPYTLALLSAVPGQAGIDLPPRERIMLRGELPSPSAKIEGCRFHTRCPFVMDVCRAVAPAPYLTPDGTVVECHLHTEGPQLGGMSVAAAAAV